MEHLGGEIAGGDVNTFTPDVWGWVCLQYEIQSVLDIGCGTAINLEWFDKMGFDVLGVEGHPLAVANSRLPGKVIQHDYTTGPWLPDREYDLCLCTEFVEHVEARYERNWLSTMSRCRYALITHALPGQGGYHHVNEQPTDYWIQRFSEHGFTHQPDVTQMLRATCKRKPAYWGRSTLTFFQRAA